MCLTFLAATMTENLNLFWIYFFIAFQLFSWIASPFLHDLNTPALCTDSEKTLPVHAGAHFFASLIFCSCSFDLWLRYWCRKLALLLEVAPDLLECLSECSWMFIIGRALPSSLNPSCVCFPFRWKAADEPTLFFLFFFFLSTGHGCPSNHQSDEQQPRPASI